MAERTQTETPGAVAFNAAPITTRPQRSRPQLPRRESRFTEQMAEEYSPAHSVYEQETSGIWSPSAPQHSTIRTSTRYGGSAAILICRGINGCLHAAGCVILMAVMIEFLTGWADSWMGYMSAQAIALLVFLGVDTLLDIFSLVCLHREWASWMLLVRMLNGFAYIALFMGYVARGRVFPADFTLWAMAPGFTGPVVYLLLWLLGVWNLVHAALRRHRLGTSARAYFPSVALPPQSLARRGSIIIPPMRTTTRSPQGSQEQGGWFRSVSSRDGGNDVENPQPTFSRATTATSPALSLRERPAEPKPESFTATTRTTSSHSSPKTDERGLARYERELEQGQQGGLSPPPPPPPTTMKL